MAADASTVTTAMAGHRDPGTGPVVPLEREIEQRRYAVQLGVWCFLATVTMLFAAFSSSYIVRQAGTDWTPTPLPTVLWFTTALLAFSSAALEVSRREAKSGHMSASRSALGATVILGISFLIGQVGAWRDLVADGFYLPTSPHASFFYVLTALHAAHLTAGLILLLYVAARVSRSERHGDTDDMPFLLGIGATFWHFFGALWIYLVAMLAWA
jgi:cytochrome c oxidase subunit 3